MARLCLSLLAVLALNGLAGLLASAWKHEGVGIRDTMLQPERSFWNSVATSASGRHHIPGIVARRRDQDSGRDGEAQQLEQHALPAPEHHWLKSQEGREATRELESLSKRPDGGDAQPLQQLMEGQPEGAGMQAEGVVGLGSETGEGGGIGSWGGMFGWLLEERVTWADRVAERMKAASLKAWEEKQLARLQAQHHSIKPGEEGSRLAVGVDPAEDVHGRTSDHCAAALRVPKVAIMFLTRGVLYHEALWEVWFRSAAGLLPMAALQAADCEAGILEHVRHSCGAKAGASLLQQQHMYSVYVHVGANELGWKGFPKGSIFHGRDISERVHVKWGTFALVEATRALLRASLEDPLNQKFVLLSEAGVPLYPPDTFYMQLMSEDKSRINACIRPGWERDVHRWVYRMETEHMRQKHWRKSSQWVALGRKHAQIVVEDKEVAAAFDAECQPTWRDGWWRDCYSDEHYFATLLATKGLDGETDCMGSIMYVDWSFGGAHPRSYSVRESTPSRLRLLRQPMDGCSYPEALSTSPAQFVHVDSVSAATCSAARVPYAGTLGYDCPLLARKFAPDTAAQILQLVTNCDSRLNISRISYC